MKSGQNCPDREDYVFAERDNYVQFATGIKSSNEKSFNIIWLLINKLNELSENILRKIVKNRKNAQSFVMFDYEDLQWEEQKNMIKKVINKIIIV